MNQYALTMVLKDSEVPQWRQAAKAAMQMLDAELRQRGDTPECAPPMPPRGNGFEGFIEQPYRILMKWIPEWTPNVNAGKHVVRVDTMLADRK